MIKKFQLIKRLVLKGNMHGKSCRCDADVLLIADTRSVLALMYNVQFEENIHISPWKVNGNSKGEVGGKSKHF